MSNGYTLVIHFVYIRNNEFVLVMIGNGKLIICFTLYVKIF